MGAAVLRVEPGEMKDSGPCACCGGESRTVWGYVHRDDRAVAIYFVAWTRGQIGLHGANFDLIVGRWGDGTGPLDRQAISFMFRRTERGPAFMVIDAADRPAARSELAGQSLARADVVDTPLAHEAFAILDAIWVQDNRISELAAS